MSTKIEFLCCDWCGVAFDVGANECNSLWCDKPKEINVVKLKLDKPKKVRKQRKKYPTDKTMSRWVSIVSRSKRRGYECDVTKDDIEAIIELPCVYCGSHERIEVDRKDSRKGYTTDNVAPACHRCNTIKNNVASYDDMMFIAGYLGWRI